MSTAFDIVTIVNFIDSLCPRQKQLLEFVQVAHGTQTRKYTGEPYWHHLARVAFRLAHIPLGTEVGLLHDLFEDTWYGQKRILLLSVLKERGYSDLESHKIYEAVWALTDPNIQDRQERIKFQNQRLSVGNFLVKSAKCADIDDNVSGLETAPTSWAIRYLSEKESQFAVLKGADPEVYGNCKKNLKKIREYFGG